MAAAIGLVVILLRRRTSATANVDGLLVEQARRLQAQQERAVYRAGAVDGTTLRNQYRP
ncbi:hypothetical protein [Streptomyces sp. YU58]|uniref:hypothetical protein n=1 Tax=Streptomyces sp. SX92 TaxID=3158972 RepID=UPI0027B9F231|nr:hypothetical protein [Streptomyces coralus]WLW52304.1 hypothetical protein QU709_13325 [Streptomyces coralus]